VTIIIFIHDYINFCVQYQNENPQLEFVKLLKATYTACDMLRFLITFEAKDIAAGGQTKTYQAVVRRTYNRHGDVSVLSFRECEQEQGQGISFKGINLISLFVFVAFIDLLRLILYMN
jgi:cystatin-related protein